MAKSRTCQRITVCFATMWMTGIGTCGYSLADDSIHHLSGDATIASMQFQSQFFGYQSAVDRDYTGPQGDWQLAYDYSAHVIRDQALGAYRLYSGGRWRGAVPGGDGDHVLQYTSTTGLGGTWSMPHTRPEFLQGAEEGKTGRWFCGNYLEPEVLRISGTYYMYTQVQVSPGEPIDAPGQSAQTEADRIQLHTSTDGNTWTRWSEQRGVVVNITNPTCTNLHHQEVVYVPSDADGKPFWIYVAVDANGVFSGYYRIRSADPTTFDFQSREPAGLAQLGNQIGYARQAPGGPLFIRITFTADATGRQVPALQFSRDGLNWFWSDEGAVLLSGSTDNLRNRNTYFLGLSTLDGTGELEYHGNDTYHTIYAASTSNSPMAPDIFYSEIGVGELTFTITSRSALSCSLAPKDMVSYGATTGTWRMSHTQCGPTYLDDLMGCRLSSWHAAAQAIGLVGDVNDDGIDDIVAVVPGVNSYEWYAAHSLRSSTGVGTLNAASTSMIAAFGTVASKLSLFLADMNGDGASDAVYVDAGLNWKVAYSVPGAGMSSARIGGPIQWGAAGDVPLVADFDGDGLADICVYRPSTGSWRVKKSSAAEFGTGGSAIASLGGPQWSPLAGDVNGDGRADGVLVRDNGQGLLSWLAGCTDTAGAVGQSSGGVSNAVAFGFPTDKPFVADINGDGMDDIGVQRVGGDGSWWWYVGFTTAGGQLYAGLSGDDIQPFGLTSTETPLIGQFDLIPSKMDFDKDGDVDRDDCALFQICFSGPDQPPGQACSESADLDGDGDVDQTDFGMFQVCFNGPHRPPILACRSPADLNQQ